MHSDGFNSRSGKTLCFETALTFCLFFLNFLVELVSVAGSEPCSIPHSDAFNLSFKTALINNGSGLTSGLIAKTTCFTITALATNGRGMDVKCRQRTFFVVLITSVEEGIKMEAEVTYHESEGYHEACYELPCAGRYTLEVQLGFTNYDALNGLLAGDSMGRRAPPLVWSRNSAIRKRVISYYIKGFQGYIPVARKVMHVTGEPAAADLAEARAGLPRCSSKLLADSQNRGFWKDLEWHPFACRHVIMSSQAIGRCLEGKNVLMIGDSQVRYNMVELANFLRFGDSARYLNVLNKRKLWTGHLNHRKQETSREGAPLQPGSKTLMESVTSYGRVGNFTFYGSLWNGLGTMSLHVSVGKDQPESLFNLTYVAHLSAGKPALKKWMVNSGLQGPAGPLGHQKAGGPFDYVLASTGLHNLKEFQSPALFGETLERVYLPSLLGLVGHDPRRITWTGLWAAQEKRKPMQFIPFSNNARGTLFDREAQRVLRDANVSWLNLKPMTLPRPDLCTDSAHYSWPLSFATLTLWLGSICHPSPAMPAEA
eukprot:TRINITY_DN30305_c0_g1_i1.p1 TRINITY_DN30305_c0_g1~~TRINITY_DN30305_c0_g1_i1.p1  ORF type:complete len:540 (-),score=79.71 TRINITY_DN30305_c0_g1_i1:185-1804(-)